MTAPIIIGLTGQPGSGKDTCAQALVPYGFAAVAFADALRLEVAQAWHLDLRMLTDRSTKEVTQPALAIRHCTDARFLHWAVFRGHRLHEARSPRWLMQRWGSEFRRAQDPAYWVRQVEQWIAQQRTHGRQRFVVTDVRLPNEADLVRRLGGYVVRVHRPELPAMAADTAGHSSEAHGALPVDAVIHNDGSLDALAGEVHRVLYCVLDLPLMEGVAP
jgi:hypothetical protein